MENAESDVLYRALDVARKEIRVLKLEPGPGIVQCTLQHVSLDDFNPEFTSVSQDGEQTEVCYQAKTEDWVDRCWNTRQKLDQCSEIIFPTWRGRHYQEHTWEKLAKQLDVGSSVLDPWYSVRGLHKYETESWLMSTRPSETFCVAPRFKWGDFEAISYCWGSEEKEGSVKLNGQVLNVPRNLEAALREIRDLSEVKSGMKIWTDALCIDQSNITEKSHQVGIMNDVFQRSFAVLVWLGSETQTSSAAIDAAVQNYHLSQYYSSEYWSNVNYVEWIATLPWEAILELFSRQYWGRLWIIQELALNHNMSLFLCGKRRMSRPMLKIMANMGWREAFLVAKVLKYRRDSRTSNAHFLQRDIWGFSFKVDVLLGLHTESIDSQMYDLADVLDLCQQAECKHSEDKIYGLLGLLPSSMRQALVPDYNKSLVEIYGTVAKELLSHRGLTDLLAWCSPSPQDHLPSWTPDWTIKSPRYHVQWLMRRTAGGDTSLGSCHSIIDKRILRCRGRIIGGISDLALSMADFLPYRAVVAGSDPSSAPNRPPRCTQRYNSDEGLSWALQRTLLMDHPSKNRWQNSTHLHALPASKELLSNIYWMEWSKLGDCSDSDILDKMAYHPTMGPVLKNPLWETFDRFRQTNAHFDVFGRPLKSFFSRTGDILEPSPRPSPDPSIDPGSNTGPIKPDLSSVDPVEGLSMDKVFREDELFNNDEQNMILATLALQGRRLMTTDTGYLGLVPEETHHTDLIAVLYGCNFPVVLRPLNDDLEGKGEPSSCYRYVGECYVDGIMDGEEMAGMDTEEASAVDVNLV